MTTFLVTTDDGTGPIRHDTIAFESEREAVREAQRALAEMANDALPNGCRAQFDATVEDISGVEVYRATLIFEGKGRSELAAFDAATDAEVEQIAAAVRGSVADD